MFPPPQSSLQRNIIFPVKYSIEPQSHLLFFFLSKVAFTVPYNNHCRCSQELWYRVYLYGKIFTRYATAVHCLARVEKPRMGKFHSLLSILLGHSAYNYMSQLNEPEIIPWPQGELVWISHILIAEFSCSLKQGGHRHNLLQGLSLARPSTQITPGNKEGSVSLPGQNHVWVLLHQQRPALASCRPQIQGWISVQAEER